MAEANELDYAAGGAAAEWWSWKIPIGAALMCIAIVGAQFLSRDFIDVGAAAMWMVGRGVPVTAVVAVLFLTAPPRGHRRRRSILAMIAAVAAIALLLALYLSTYVRPEMHRVVEVAIFLLTLLAGSGAYLHLARALHAAHRPLASAAFLVLALLILLNATLYMTRYGTQMGLLNAAWTYSIPGVGERVTPFAFVQDFLTRPQVEMRKNIEEPLRGAYVLVTVVTPIWCFALMIWLMSAGNLADSRNRPPPGP